MPAIVRSVWHSKQPNTDDKPMINDHMFKCNNNNSMACWQSNGMGRHRGQHACWILLVHLCQSGWHSGACRGNEVSKVLIFANFSHLSTSGLWNLWPHKLIQHHISIGAGPQTDKHYWRSTQNHIPFPTGLPGGPALQFGGFQGHVSVTHRIGLRLVPLQPTLLLTLVFNPPGSILLGVYKK